MILAVVIVVDVVREIAVVMEVDVVRVVAIVKRDWGDTVTVIRLWHFHIMDGCCSCVGKCV